MPPIEHAGLKRLPSSSRVQSCAVGMPQSAQKKTPVWFRREAGVIFALAAAGMLAGAGCGPKPAAPPGRAGVRTVAAATTQTSETCQHCHAAIYDAWAGTDHALANRRIDARRDAAVFSAASPAVAGGSHFDLAWEAGRAVMTERRNDGQAYRHEAEFILGSKPLWQPLVTAPGGRWQPTDLAYDPARKEWFNVFGQEGRKPGEWGHWTGRGMNWNSMCAHCHMTGYRKNYESATDSYASKWVEHGVGCIQCHGPMPDGHDALPVGATRKPGLPPSPPFHGDRQRMMQTCAPCHARNELLTADFQPGDSYDDHYRVTLPVDPAVFYPDGQQRDEDFNWTSVRLSRMGHAGVTCLDCHDPHTNKTLLPATDNNLCLRCHGAPGPTKAPVIDPVAHSHHQPESTGNQCVTCHMPTTNYMQRSPRHDHGWLKPDPLLTKELGIPNACNRCHADKTTEWAIQAAENWYGARLDGAQRIRTRAVAAAQARNPAAVESLLNLLRTEEVPAWRATFLDLLAPFERTDPVVTAATASLAAKDPLERAAAVRLLTGHAGSLERLRPSLKDPVRLVRLDAAWAFSAELVPDSPERKELDAYLALSLDQPGGRFRLGQDLANRGRFEEAAREMTRATEWDPNSPGMHDALGFVLSAGGRPLEAAAAFLRAAELQPDDAQSAYRAALAYAEARRLSDAEHALRLALERDPRFDRAWYNLGLLLAQTGRLPQAIEALQNAEKAAPTIADYPYALATVLLRAGDVEGARAAARRTLAIDPTHTAARQLLRSP